MMLSTIVDDTYLSRVEVLVNPVPTPLVVPMTTQLARIERLRNESLHPVDPPRFGYAFPSCGISEIGKR